MQVWHLAHSRLRWTLATLLFIHDLFLTAARAAPITSIPGSLSRTTDTHIKQRRGKADDLTSSALSAYSSALGLTEDPETALESITSTGRTSTTPTSVSKGLTDSATSIYSSATKAVKSQVTSLTGAEEDDDGPEDDSQGPEEVLSTWMNLLYFCLLMALLTCVLLIAVLGLCLRKRSRECSELKSALAAHGDGSDGSEKAVAEEAGPQTEPWVVPEVTVTEHSDPAPGSLQEEFPYRPSRAGTPSLYSQGSVEALQNAKGAAPGQSWSSEQTETRSVAAPGGIGKA